MAEEKQQSRQASLTLQVMNGNELESGRAAKCLFSENGGDIGHTPECHWQVQDRAGSIAARACTVIRHDGAYCLRCLTPGLMINLAPASSDALIRLRQGDEIQLGALALKVFLHDGAAVTYDERMATPETIVMNRDSLADTLLTTEGQPAYPGMPFQHQLAPTVAHGFSSDPLQALQTESLMVADDPIAPRVSRPVAPASDLTGANGINTPFMDLPPGNARHEDGDEFSAMAQYHLAVTPLLRGMECPLTLHNSQDADEFLEEAGRALQAAIKGLLSLQQQQNSLSDKHLRPLEDNPLRLDMDYATALNVMFAEGKSPVHLAAPAAIAESLRNIRHHEEANRAAIVEALRVMLDAFSPGNLMRRFAQYRRSHELRQKMDDAWAWQMYSNYYDELASSRQQGFEMLFNEVYAQVYDRVLREKTAGAGSMNGKAFLACVLMSVVLTGCETAKKISQVIRNPDIQVGKLMDQSTELTVTLLTEPDSNLTADGEAAPVDVQLVYLSDDSKFHAADYDQVATTALPDVLGKNYIDHQDFNLLPDTVKTLPPIKLDEKTGYIGVIAYFSDDQATEWKQIESVESIGHHYRLLVHIRASAIEMKKEEN